MQPGTVIVNRLELLKALKQLAPGVKGKHPAQLILYTEADKLHFRAGAISYYIPATGSFNGIGHMSGLVVKGLKAFVPETEEVTLYQSDDRLSFGNSRFTCTWGLKEDPAPIIVPLNLSYLDTLTLRYKYTPEEIHANGYTEVMAKAELKKTADVSKAFDALSKYKVKYSQLENLVDEAIKQAVQEGNPRAT